MDCTLFDFASWAWIYFARCSSTIYLRSAALEAFWALLASYTAYRSAFSRIAYSRAAYRARLRAIFFSLASRAFPDLVIAY